MKLTNGSLEALQQHLALVDPSNPIVEVVAITSLSECNESAGTGIMNLAKISLDFTFEPKEVIAGTKHRIDLETGVCTVVSNDQGRMQLTIASLKELNHEITESEGSATSLIINVHSIDLENSVCSMYGLNVAVNPYPENTPVDGYFHVNLVTGECIPEALHKLRCAINQ